jgi:LacI family transcriptional regulator
MALGALDELRRRGLRIGQDLGFIMFDDTPWAPLITPPVSVVAQPAYDIGAQAAGLLFRQIREPLAAVPQRITLSTTLIVRDSSRRL